jgi:hypothetical protein
MMAPPPRPAAMLAMEARGRGRSRNLKRPTAEASLSPRPRGRPRKDSIAGAPERGQSRLRNYITAPNSDPIESSPQAPTITPATPTLTSSEGQPHGENPHF